MKTSTIKSSFITLISILGLIVVWEIISQIINSGVIFPSPKATFISLIEIIKNGNFLLTVLSTVARGLFAFIIACSLGIIVGIIIGISKVLRTFTKPMLILIMSTPIVSFILLALIWFKSSNVPVFVAFLMIFPIIVSNVSEGIVNVDQKLLQMAQIYKVGKSKILWNIYLPSIASYLIAGITTSLAIGWKVIVTAEVLSQPQFAIGTSLQTSKIYLETSSVFAWTLVAVAISFAFEKLIRTFEAKLVRWR